MSDLIDRETVYQLLMDKAGDAYGFEEIRKIVDALPSVTPSRRKGHWIDYSEDGFVECPFCEHATNCEGDIDELHYCFYCGAKMLEPQESEVNNG